jgi:hypothetical protein
MRLLESTLRVGRKDQPEGGTDEGEAGVVERKVVERRIVPWISNPAIRV